jgi:hypothetical protein
MNSALYFDKFWKPVEVEAKESLLASNMLDGSFVEAKGE